MPQINLLPWREEQRKQRQTSFVQLTILIGMATLLVILLIGQLVSYRIDNQNSRNQLIQSEINILNSEIQEVRALRKKRDQLLSWIDVVQSLQHNRSDIVHILNSIAGATGPELYLTQLRFEGRTLTLQGEAENNREISNLMRRLAQSEVLANPTLTDVSSSSVNTGFNRFTLQIEHKGSTSTPREAK